MYSFKNDYAEGAHQNVLKKLSETNLVQGAGYGEDDFCRQAAHLIKKKVLCQDVDVHFLSGGTQTNLTAISAFLRPHEAVLSAATGHIEEHETGAIEATGHKIITIETADGKLSPDLIQRKLDFHTDEHMVKPRLVYVSNATELGTTYSKAQIVALSKFCKANNLLFYLDGARIGSAICSKGADLTLSDVCANTDAFYIGGTKNGALLGEALVIKNEALKVDFRFHMKQKGALLAKSRVIGLQFLALFEDDLYFDLARHANKMADILREGVEKAGFSFMAQSTANMLFPILPMGVIDKLKEAYSFHVFPIGSDTHCGIRLVTSFATDEQDARAFVQALNNAAGSK